MYSLLSGFPNIVHLKADPMVAADMSRLRLAPGSFMRAVVLPDLASMDEQAVLGNKPATADAEALAVCT